MKKGTLVYAILEDLKEKKLFFTAVLLASGQIIYFGRSSQMIDYFESVNFPCPMFKNPCDYYGNVFF